MNRHAFSFVILCCLFGLFAPQLKAQSTDLPPVGKSYWYSTPEIFVKAELNKKGAGQTWDFSKFVAISQRKIETVEPTQTGPTFAAWPQVYDRSYTDLAVKGDTVHLPPFKLTDLVRYYKEHGDSIPTRLQALAGVFHFNRGQREFSTQIKTTGDLYGRPLRLGKRFSAQQSGAFSEPETGTLFTARRTIDAEVIAEGAVLLPDSGLANGSDQHMAIRRRITTTYRLKSGGESLPEMQHESIEYEWVNTESDMPVAIVRADLVDGKEHIREVLYQDKEIDFHPHPMISNDAVVLGILLGILALIFYSSSLKTGFWSKFYRYVPALLLCYFVPSVLNSLGIISGEESSLYHVSSRYLLPTSLVLLTLSIDLSSIRRLGPKAVGMFLTGTLGIVIGGPIAILIVSSFSPETVAGEGADAVWRGLTTVAGSWIGGGANQTAMKEVFGAGDKIFSTMIAVDVIVANLWMGLLLYGSGITKKIDKMFKADASSIDEVRDKLANYQAQVAKIPNLTETMILVAIGFGVTAVSHFLADIIAPWIGDNYPDLAKFSLNSKFFWLIVLATTGGLVLSFTRARKMEGVGASRMGSLFLYVLVASIGMKMDITAVAASPKLFLVGGIWMLIHAGLQLGMGRLMKAPFFFIAVGSQANVGGAASAPVVASAFHPALAPVGVLLAVLGYALGTYAAYGCGLLMQAVAP